MKIKKLLYCSVLFVSVLASAQTQEQRNEIKKSNNTESLTKIQKKSQFKFEQDEQNVLEFLKNNPSVKRSFTKNKSIYYIKSIDENGNPVYISTKSNIASGQLIKANSLYGGGSIGTNITGTNMVAGVWDGGPVRTTHELLAGQVTQMPNQTVNTVAGADHMNHVTGTIVGKNLQGNTARGIAYDATARCYDWNNDVAETAAFAAAGFLISNHSYGMGNVAPQALWTYGAYMQSTQATDEVAKDAPNYLQFWAAGNEQTTNGNGKTGALQGYDVITGQSAAKNVMTVGALNGDGSISDYTCFGPTDDGRIKPDIVTRGTAINSAQSTSDTAYSGEVNSDGTSYASPAAAAGALLLQQYYFSLNNAYMSASMLKCLLTHSATDLGTAGPDAKFGWGLMDVERAANILKDTKNNGKARMYTFTTNPAADATSEIDITGATTSSQTPGLGAAEVKATMCWTDNEGVEQLVTDGVDPVAKRLVYNFDFALTNTTSNSYISRPFKELSMASPAAAVTLATAWFQNNSDNVKQTLVSVGGAAGDSYRLSVRKSASSPAAVRNISVIISGLTQGFSLANDDFALNNSTVFYSKIDNKLKMISNENTAFGNYQIFDINGKSVGKGNAATNEILVDNLSAGVYILNFEVNGTTKSFKFIK